jgi:hypothetical protein
MQESRGLITADAGEYNTSGKSENPIGPSPHQLGPPEEPLITSERLDRQREAPSRTRRSQRTAISPCSASGKPVRAVSGVSIPGENPARGQVTSP